MILVCPECRGSFPGEVIERLGFCHDCWVKQRRTPEEIETLKKNWDKDTCWDIETTEGYELHTKELLDYRLKTEKHWAEQRTRWPEWEAVRPSVDGAAVTRLPLWGGWLVKTFQSIEPEGNEGMVSTFFLPDIKHEWLVGEVGDYTDTNRPIIQESEFDEMRRSLEGKIKE
jgi:hypothetical protein